MGKLSEIRNHITASTKDTKGIISPQEITLFREYIGDIISYGEKLNTLKRKDYFTLNVIDFDDTLYSRLTQLQKALFNERRGEAANEIIDYILGIEKFINLFYSRSGAVESLLGVLTEQTKNQRALILTSGREKVQKLKCRALGIHDSFVPLSVVSDASEKPKALLQYIIETLGFIPGKIIVYDDKTEYFERLGGVLARYLDSEIVINKISLSQDVTTKIKGIKQKIIQPHKSPDSFPNSK